jgi:hypothetical protein
MAAVTTDARQADPGQRSDAQNTGSIITRAADQARVMAPAFPCQSFCKRLKGSVNERQTEGFDFESARIQFRTYCCLTINQREVPTKCQLRASDNLHCSLSRIL